MTQAFKAFLVSFLSFLFISSWSLLLSLSLSLSSLNTCYTTRKQENNMAVSIQIGRDERSWEASNTFKYTIQSIYSLRDGYREPELVVLVRLAP